MTARAAVERTKHALVEGPTNSHRLRQGDAKDHQGHADGRGGETAPRPAGGRGGASLCRAHGDGAGQSRLGHSPVRVRRCLPAMARARPICWSSPPPSAACAAASTPPSSALARERMLGLQAEGKTVKILCIGKKGYDQLRRQFEKQIIDLIDLRARAPDRLRQRRSDRQEDHRDVRGGRVRRRDPVLFEIPLGDPADSDGAAADPGAVRRRRSRRRAPTNTSRTRTKFSPTLLPRNISVQIFRALLENAASEQGARMSAMDNATRNAGDMIKKQTTIYNRSRQAHDHQGTDRNHLGRRSALTV